MDASPEQPARRRLLSWFVNSALGATLAASFYPLLRFLIPPEVAEAQSVSSVVGSLNELALNSGKVFRFGSLPALVIRQADGNLIAFEANCTHLSCIVQYRSDTQQIWCACHNGYFDLTGKNVAGPPPRPLSPLKVNLSGQDLVVTRS